MKTTNIVIKTPLNTNTLNDNLTLAKYSFSTNEFYKLKQIDKKYAFAKFHNLQKDTLDRPYYFYSYDKPHPALYVLFERINELRPIKFDFVNNAGNTIISIESSPEIISFQEVKLHVLMKILSANYFKIRAECVCQSKFYVLAGKATALEIELKEYINNREEELLKEFHIDSHAVNCFKTNKIDADYFTKIYSYYEVIPKWELKYLRQIKPSRVVETLGKSEIYSLKTPERAKPAKLPWFEVNDTDPEKLENTRSYILEDYQSSFIDYLNKWGITAIAKERDFQEVPLSREITDYKLPVDTLRTIYILDNRLNRNRISITDYISLFEEHYGVTAKGKTNVHPLKFKAITESELSALTPVLILQDCRKEDFSDEFGKQGLLKKYGIEDPKERIYKQYKHVPKQTLTVLPSAHYSSKFKSVDEYLNYELFELNDSFKHKFDVCFNELYLKNLLLNDVNINHLPCIADLPDNVIFITANCFLTIKNSKFKIRSFENDRQPLNELLSVWRLKWSDIVTVYREKYKKRFKDEEISDEAKEEQINIWLKNAFFIISEGQVIEIEQMKERAFYNLKEISHRLQARHREKADEGKKYRYESKNPKDPSLLEGYEGIWYCDQDRLYIVGSTSSMQYNQPKAHLIRKFDLYTLTTSSFFEPDVFLQSMSVSFVRHKQFTVYPYFFDLIRLYCEIHQY